MYVSRGRGEDMGGREGERKRGREGGRCEEEKRGKWAGVQYGMKGWQSWCRGGKEEKKCEW